MLVSITKECHIFNRNMKIKKKFYADKHHVSAKVRKLINEFFKTDEWKEILADVKLSIKNDDGHEFNEFYENQNDLIFKYTKKITRDYENKIAILMSIENDPMGCDDATYDWVKDSMNSWMSTLDAVIFSYMREVIYEAFSTKYKSLNL